MTTKLSTIFLGLKQQQFPAMTTILNKAADFSKQHNQSEAVLLERRLIEDMHPLTWQVQTFCELAERGFARLSGAEPITLEFKEESFAGLIDRVKESGERLVIRDAAAFDASVSKQFTLPIGPDATLTLSGEDYVLKFLLPNIYFHLTTTYNILRSAGVEIGKREFMGPIIS